MLIHAEIVGNVPMSEAFLGTPTDSKVCKKFPIVVVDVSDIMRSIALVNDGLQFTGNTFSVLLIDGRHVWPFSALIP